MHLCKCVLGADVWEEGEGAYVPEDALSRDDVAADGLRWQYLLLSRLRV